MNDRQVHTSEEDNCATVSGSRYIPIIKKRQILILSEKAILHRQDVDHKMHKHSPNKAFKKNQSLLLDNPVSFSRFNASPCGPSSKVSSGLDSFLSLFVFFFL